MLRSVSISLATIAALVLVSELALGQSTLESGANHLLLCAPGENGATCFREWFNPLAAIITFLAVWYAARQVKEAARQSDASIRANLSNMMKDLAAEVAFVEQTEIWSRGWQSHLVESMTRHMKDGTPLEHVPMLFDIGELNRAPAHLMQQRDAISRAFHAINISIDDFNKASPQIAAQASRKIADANAELSRTLAAYHEPLLLFMNKVAGLATEIDDALLNDATQLLARKKRALGKN